jgi:hypothetical protein
MFLKMDHTSSPLLASIYDIGLRYSALTNRTSPMPYLDPNAISPARIVGRGNIRRHLKHYGKLL